MDVPRNFKTMYMGKLDIDLQRFEDKQMYRIMMVACKKALTRKWFKTELPTVDDWFNVVLTVYVMEKLSFSF